MLNGNLRRGLSKSCGCYKREVSAQGARSRFTVHGFRFHPLYAVWSDMMKRCYNPAHRHYHRYGGRGIGVCDRWHDVACFVQDVELEIGLRPEGRYPSGRPLYSLDRTDNNGHYEPGKVRWATASQQTRNSAVCLEDGILPVGSQHHNAKLTEVIVLECRRRNAGGESRRALAREFGVNPSTLGDAIVGATWRHVGAGQG